MRSVNVAEKSDPLNLWIKEYSQKDVDNILLKAHDYLGKENFDLLPLTMTILEVDQLVNGIGN